MEKSNVLKKLFLLILVFISGILLLILLNSFFITLNEKLDSKSKNLQSKIDISKLIIDNLYKIRSDFYELSNTSSNEKTRNFIKNKIKEKITHIESALYIMEKGGTIDNIIKLNIVGYSKTNQVISYRPPLNQKISVESIELRPKLNQILNMIDDLEHLLSEKNFYKEAKDFDKYISIDNKIINFYKNTPSFFTRIIEDSSRSLFEGHKALEELENEILNKKSFYSKIEITLILIIIILSIYLSILIAKNINEIIKKLRENQIFTRGILDAQSNIVIVSDGEKMIDANKALVDFFEGYETFEDFKNKHKCICDFFEKIELENFLTDKIIDNKYWFEYPLENPEIEYKVAMYKGYELKYFKLNAVQSSFKNSNAKIIVSLLDITEEFITQKKLQYLNDNLENLVDIKTKELKELNDNLEFKVNEEIVNNREKDKKLIEQSRYAALGEMIGNIAHQWRQPLSGISSIASGEILKIDLGLQTNDDSKNAFNKITKYTDFLTKTIEDFRNFFNANKEITEFDLIESINNTLCLVESSYKTSDITLIKNFSKERFIITGYQNEISQAFLNILTNAKDALTEKDLEKKIVEISIFENDEKIHIKFQDNGQGIDPIILDKIFDPYFTTKHKSQGTGIGLYMSKEIIEKHMNGILKVKNKEFKVDEISHFGACFTIILPKEF